MVKFTPFAFFALLSASSALASPTSAVDVLHRRRHHQKHAVVARAELEALVPVDAPVPSVPRQISRRKTCKPRTASESDSESDSTSASESESATSTKTASSTKTGSSTKTASSAAESTSASDGESSDNGGGISGGSGSASALFPVTDGAITIWTTASDGDNGKKYSLSKDTLGIFKQSVAPKYTTFEGKSALQAHFPKGSCNPGNPSAPEGGLSFYAPGPTPLTAGDAVLMSYRVFFQDGFGFRIGGKMPGLYIGTSQDTGVKCSGGRYSETCASARLMWREGGAGESYAYLQQVKENKNKCGKKADGPCDSNYGSSMGRGTWTWTSGRWITVGQLVKLNDATSSSYTANGETTIYIDGKVATKITGLVWRRTNKLKVQGMQVQTFFGGHEAAEWGSPKDQNCYFADFGAAVFA